MAADGRGGRELLALIHQHLLRGGYARAARELQAQTGQVTGSKGPVGESVGVGVGWDRGGSEAWRGAGRPRSPGLGGAGGGGAGAPCSLTARRSPALGSPGLRLHAGQQLHAALRWTHVLARPRVGVPFPAPLRARGLARARAGREGKAEPGSPADKAVPYREGGSCSPNTCCCG